MHMKKKLTKVILVDDHPVVMEGLKALLSNNEHLSVVGGFTTGKETLTFLKRNNVDVIFLDIALPDMNGLDLCRTLKEQYPDTLILAISNHDERSMISQMLQNGASGYLLKNSSSEELMQAIEQALRGELALTPEVKKVLIHGAIEKTRNIPRLTRREREIIKLVADGLTTANIAEKLFISPLTVETHRRNLMQKFEVANTAALIKTAVDAGLL